MRGTYRFLGLIIALIGALMFYIRTLSPGFVLGTTTIEHPYIPFVAALMLAGCLWVVMIPLLKQISFSNKTLWLILFISLIYKSFFVGSTPIYEDDWNRYLWDGAVTSKGYSPYAYSPVDIIEGQNSEDKALSELAAFAAEHDMIPERINYPGLKTIYPPGAQFIFTTAAFLKPLDLDALRIIYLIIDAMTLLLMVKALQLYGRNPHWAILYAFNPLLIYSGFNATHMDVMLAMPVLIALIYIKDNRAPIRAAIALSVAAAIKLWPLIRLKYIGIAGLVAVLSLLLNLPLLMSMGENSGLSAYTGEWQRSSFIFPILQNILEIVSDQPGRIARMAVAVSVSLVALYFGFRSQPSDTKLPLALLIVTASLIFLSPTGYPWYLYWVLLFLPFVPSYGLGFLSVFISLYYLRYALAERGYSDIYTDWLIPLQFGIPLLIIAYEIWVSRRKASI